MLGPMCELELPEYETVEEGHKAWAAYDALVDSLGEEVVRDALKHEARLRWGDRGSQIDVEELRLLATQGPASDWDPKLKTLVDNHGRPWKHWQVRAQEILDRI